MENNKLALHSYQPQLILANHQNNMSSILMDNTGNRLGSLEEKISETEKNVSKIESNYLSKSSFYKACVTGLVILIGAAFALYTHIDKKYEDRFAKINERFEKVESNIHSLDVRIVKVEHKLDVLEKRLDTVEKKLDGIDDKLDLLIQQKNAQK